VSGPDEAERIARAALTWVAEPGDPVMGGLLRSCSPTEIVAALIEGRRPRIAAVPADAPETTVTREDGGALWGDDALCAGGAEQASNPRLVRALNRWSARLGEVPSATGLAALWRDGIRLVIPGDAEWPSQLDMLGDARPWGLWARGHTDLRYACLRSVSVVGTRTATGYGIHVGGELAASLAEKGWTIVSGGA